MTLTEVRKPVDDAGMAGVAARGAGVTLAGQVVRFGVQLGGTVVLARLLLPSDFGLVAMVIALVGVAEVFRDLGLSSAAIQARELTRAQRDNLFWLNTMIGAVLTVVVGAGAGLVARAYAEPLLVGITQALSLTFFLNGLATQYRADLTRHMRYRALSVIDVIVPVVALGGGVVVALNGGGFWALVVQQLLAAAVGLVLAALIVGWLPRRPRRHQSMGSLIRFGCRLLGVQVVTYVSQNVDTVVIGSRFGADVAGLYSRAFQLFAMPLNQINAPATRVALPVLSRMRDDQPRFDRYVLRGQSVLVHVVTACFAFGCALGGQLIDVVLGPRWDAAAPVFQILCVAGAFQACSYATYWVFLAKGLPGQNLRYSLMSRPILVLGIVVGSQYGVFGVATGYAVGIVLMWPLGLWWVSRVAQAPSWRMAANGIRAICGHAGAGAGAFLAAHQVAAGAPVRALVVGIAGYLVGGAVVTVVWPAFRRDLTGAVTALAAARSR